MNIQVVDEIPKNFKDGNNQSRPFGYLEPCKSNNTTNGSKETLWISSNICYSQPIKTLGLEFEPMHLSVRTLHIFVF